MKSESDIEVAAIDHSKARLPVRQANPTLDPAWDLDLRAWPGATVFHTAAWARVLAEAYGYTPIYFETRNSTGIESLLPVMEVDSWMTGRRGVSLPFSDECEPLCRDSEAYAHLFTAALACARDRRWRYLECRGGLAFQPSAMASVRYLGHRLPLHRNEEALFLRCASSARRAVRKAEQNGVSVSFSREPQALRTFYSLFCRTRKRLGAPPQPFEFFKCIQRHILEKDLGVVVLAHSGKTPIAGAIFFSFCKRALYKFGASDENFLHLRGNNLVMWEAIKHYCRHGFEVLEFGRTSVTNEGLKKFKESWGTEEYDIRYTRRDPNTGAFFAIGDREAHSRANLLKFLPSPLFNLVGSTLYRHLP